MRYFLLLVLLSFSMPSHAVLQLDERGCQNYAIWARDIVWAKSVGANKEKVMESLAEFREGMSAPVFVLVLRHFEMLWSTGMPWHLVGGLAYRECIERRGKYEDVT